MRALGKAQRDSATRQSRSRRSGSPTNASLIRGIRQRAIRKHAAEIEKGYDHPLMAPTGEEPAPTDEFAACGISKGRDIYKRFIPNFYFGCEADDRMAATAFNPRLNHFDARLKAMFGSDVGHFDVPDMTQVLAEAFDLVEH